VTVETAPEPKKPRKEKTIEEQLAEMSARIDRLEQVHTHETGRGMLNYVGKPTVIKEGRFVLLSDDTLIQK
jgi:hypothetical protein